MILNFAVGLLSVVLAAQQGDCGGEERWPVKVGADVAATQLDPNAGITTTLHDLVRLTRPTLPSDDLTRTTAERAVRIVEGHLVRFKKETGKTGDSDYHLVISDETLLFSPGGPGTTPSEHSVIAEIPDPDCIAGREGDGPTPSHLQARLEAVRAKFEQQFPHVVAGWNDAAGIPVRLLGVEFFDRPHDQVGRALNGLELHPLLDIEFDPGLVGGPAVTTLLTNSDFESGPTGWTATFGVISTDASEPAHSGSGKAWLGGFGTAHTDRLSQDVTLPASANAVSLSFFLHIDTEENNTQSLDKLRIRVRDASGHLKTLATYSNQNAAPGYVLRSFDLTAYKGQAIRLEFEAKEDDGSVTSFVIDDVVIRIEPN